MGFTSLAYAVMAFMELRKKCRHAVPKKYNPTENMCYKSRNGLCDIGVCPVIVGLKEEVGIIPLPAENSGVLI